MSEGVKLKTALDLYGYTTGIKDGTIGSPRLQFDFADVKPMNRAFAPMANEGAYDLSEMAIVTFVQALAYGKPITLLPAVMYNRFHHSSIVKATGGPIHGPHDLSGKRIGVRAYTQTTGVWVRGILYAEYGLDLDSLINVTVEGGHIREYPDPPNVVRVPNRPFLDMLLEGEIDAWIAGRDAPPDPRIAPVIDDAEAAEAEWFDRVGAFPINHMLVIRTALLDEHPWIAEEIFDVLRRGKSAYLDPLRTREPANADEAFRKKLLDRGQDPVPFGVETLRHSLETVIDYALAQKLIPRRFSVDELFDPRVRTLA